MKNGSLRACASSARTVTNHVDRRRRCCRPVAAWWSYTVVRINIVLHRQRPGRICVWKARGKLDGAGGEDSRLMYTHAQQICIHARRGNKEKRQKRRRRIIIQK